MNKHDLPESSGDTAPSKPESVDQGRRKLSKVALATPIVASLAARPALACSVSGFMSGNTSPGHDPRCDGYGCTPGFWKNNMEAWARTPYSPGVCSKWDKGVCKCWEITGTKLLQILPSSCVTPFEGYKNLYLLEILKRSFMTSTYGQIYTQMAHYIAAVLNASASEVSYGSSVADIQAGLCKAQTDGKVSYFTTTLLAGLNERGCMFNAHGDCVTPNFVSVNGVCTPACPTGQTWNSTTMKCETVTPTP